MFQSARLKLTAWYLLIIMGMSIIFSIAFYSVTTREVQRLTDRMEYEVKDPYNPFFVPPPITQQRIEDLEESRQRVLFSLIILNGIIFFVSGGGGYFLAGITLRPIQRMVSEQHRFVTDASHELRTPLTATRTAVEVALRDKSLTLTNAKKTLESNLEDIASIQLLSDDLLRLSQFENTQTSIVSGKVAIQDVIVSAVKKVGVLAKAKEITINQKITKQFVKGDTQSLEELFVIFLDNAIKYSSKESSILITTKRTDGHLLIAIEDTGIGIEKADIGHIFDRFYRAEKSRTKNNAEGYGLGLSIAKKIIEEHKGKVKVESEIGKGTTFTILLPAIS